MGDGCIGGGNIQHILVCDTAQRHSALSGYRCAGGSVLIKLIGVDVVPGIRCACMITNVGQHMLHHVIEKLIRHLAVIYDLKSLTVCHHKGEVFFLQPGNCAKVYRSLLTNCAVGIYQRLLHLVEIVGLHKYNTEQAHQHIVQCQHPYGEQDQLIPQGALKLPLHQPSSL